jgi:hypothetical protein
MKFLVLFLISLNIYAADSFDVPAIKVEINATDVMNKINRVINNPEGVLVRYVPVGGTYKNKKVSNNQVSFIMTKKVLIITKTFLVNFLVDIHPTKNVCKNNEAGFKYVVDLNGSDDLVIDNIDRLEFDICLKENNSSSVTANVSGKIFKGQNYSEPVGTIAKNTIQDQVDPFVKAIKEEVVNLNF